MRKIMRKIALISLTVLCAFCTLLGVACKTTPPNPTYSLNETAIEVELFNSYELIAYKDGEKVSATWTVSGETVTVDEMGNVTAIAVGESTVTATVEEKTLTCVVSVVAPATVPLLSLDAVNVGLKVGEERTLRPSFVWKGQDEALPADLVYISSNPSAVTATKNADGSCNLKALAACENVEITAQGHWNGLLLTCKSIVNVKSNVDIYLSSTAVELYTMDYEDLSTETQVSVTKVVEDGTTVSSPEIIWGTDNDNLVTVDNGTISAMGTAGETRVWAAWTDGLGDTHKSYVGVSIKVTNIDKTASMAKELFLNPNDGEAKINVADYQLDLGTDSNAVTLRDVTDSDNKKIVSLQLNATGEVVPTLSELVAGERIFELEKENIFCVTFNATVYSLVIDTKEELLNWQDYTVKGEVQTEEIKNMTVSYIDSKWASKTQKFDRTYKYWAYDGYVVLGANIDLTFARGTNSSGTVTNGLIKMDENGEKAVGSDIIATEDFCVKYNNTALNCPEYGFMGTFDGRGYTISGGVYGAGGLFGGVGGTGVVKNLAIKDAALFLTTYAGSGLGSDGTLNTDANVDWGDNAIIGRTFCGTMENCLIEVKYNPRMLDADFADKKIEISGVTTANGETTTTTLTVNHSKSVMSTVFFSINGTLKDVVIYNPKYDDGKHNKCTLCVAVVDENIAEFENVYVYTNYEQPAADASSKADLTSGSANPTITGVTRALRSVKITQDIIDSLDSSLWDITLGARVDQNGFNLKPMTQA